MYIVHLILGYTSKRCIGYLILYCHDLVGLRLTYKMGFGLDDWIYCILYIHTTEDYRQLQRCR
jgi:hypothetical protein